MCWRKLRFTSGEEGKEKQTRSRDVGLVNSFAFW